MSERKSRTEDASPAQRPAGAPREGGVEASLRQFLDALDSPVWLTDAELSVVWINPAAARFLEIPHDACVGHRLTDWLPGVAGRTSAETLAQWWGGEAPHSRRLECVLDNGKGRELDALLSIHALRTGHGRDARLSGFACLAHDLTERRRVEAQLRESDERMRVAIDAMRDPLVTIDALGTILEVNQATVRTFGYSEKELVGENVKVLMPEPHCSLHDEYLARYRATGRTWILNQPRDFEVVRKDGSRILCSLSVSRAERPGGRGALFTGTLRDVTERRRAELQLRESELRFHALFDHSFEYFGMLALDGRILEVNQSALDAVGATRDEVIGREFAETKWWRHSPELQARLRAAIAQAARGEFVRFEATHPQRDGTLLEVDFTLKPVRDPSGAVVMLIPEGRNISELRRAQRAETAMLRALATVGESAALLAHEIKNPITAVNLALRAVADQLGEDHKEVLEDLVGRMQRLEQMMRRTLSFARPLELKRAIVEIRPLLESCVRNLGPQIAATGSSVVLRGDPGALRVDVDPGLFEEVVSNLVTNAIEAKGSAARVEIVAGSSAQGDVTLCVDDDGPGIPATMRAKLFKPFVTTKARGNGFGLAICRKVVEEHGGTIAIATSPMGGARFEIHLPRAP